MSSYRMSNVQFNTRAMDHLLRDPTGDVGTHMRSIGVRIVTMARRLCGSETGRLAQSIRMSQARAAGGQRLTVGAYVKYAFFVHEGTKPHLIDPIGHRVMAFNSHGRRIYTQAVHHPGTRGKRYLTIPLSRVVR